MTISCEKVELDYFQRAAFCFTATKIVTATPARIFELFLDADSWTKWVPVITKVEWTSPFPVAVGSTRTVSMMGGLVGHEEFIAWEPGKRMAFRFNETSKKMTQAFAEDYVVTDLGNGTTRIDWRMAMDPYGIQRHTMKPMAPIMQSALGFTLGRFKKYAESNPPVPTAPLNQAPKATD